MPRRFGATIRGGARSLRRTPHPDIPFKNKIIESGAEAGAAEIKNPEVFSEPGVNFY